MGDGLFEDDDDDAGDLPDAPDRLWRHPAERGAELAAANMAGRQVVGRRWPAMAVSFVAGATLVGTMWLFTEPNDRPIGTIQTVEVPPSVASDIAGPIASDEIALEWSENNARSVVGLYLGNQDDGTVTQALLYRTDGHLIASAHAIAGAEELTAMFSDGQLLPAKVVATDSVSGIAVLKANTPEVDPVAWWDGGVHRGDDLVAIANPSDDNQVVVRMVELLGTDQVTMMPNSDLLSGLFRISTELDVDWSGSPLVNEHGGVVAMTVAGSDGTNYAIPTARLRRIADDLITDQTTEHKPWIGVHLAAGLTDSLKNERGVRGGALVTRVFDSTPADRAGLAAGDVIVGIGELTVSTKEDLTQALRARRPGDEVTIRYSRLVMPESPDPTKQYSDVFEASPEIFTTTMTLGAQPVI